MKIKYGDLIRIIIKDGGLEMIALEYEDITSLCDVFYRVRKYLITSGLCIPVRVTVINFDRSVLMRHGLIAILIQQNTALLEISL